MVKKILTTYDIARYAQVTPRTVIQWINEGKLKAYRTPGNHSRVTIEEAVSFLRKYRMPVPEELTVEGSEEKKRILIVDDDPGIVESIRRILVREKIYDLACAQDGFEAGEKFASFKPHLIILDIRMPGVDGYKVCSRIRSSQTGDLVKILFVSGFIDEREIGLIQASGADDYLAKPFSNKELTAKITGLFGWNRREGDKSHLTLT